MHGRSGVTSAWYVSCSGRVALCFRRGLKTLRTCYTVGRGSLRERPSYFRFLTLNVKSFLLCPVHSGRPGKGYPYLSQEMTNGRTYACLFLSWKACFRRRWPILVTFLDRRTVECTVTGHGWRGCTTSVSCGTGATCLSKSWSDTCLGSWSAFISVTFMSPKEDRSVCHLTRCTPHHWNRLTTGLTFLLYLASACHAFEGSFLYYTNIGRLQAGQADDGR